MTESEIKTENLHKFKNNEGDIVVPEPDFVPSLADDNFEDGFDPSLTEREPELAVDDTNFEVPALEPDEEAPIPIVPASPFNGDPYSAADSSVLDRLTESHNDSLKQQQRAEEAAAARRLAEKHAKARESLADVPDARRKILNTYR